MSEKLIDPARPPLPTAWNFPFQSTVGIQTSKRIAGAMTPLTRQIGRAMLPTGAGFWPAGSDSTSMMVVSGKLRSAKVLMVHGALAAAAGAGASETVTIRAVERRRRKKRRLIRHLLLLVESFEDYCRTSRLVQYYFSMTAIGFSYDPGFLLVFVDTLTMKTVLGWSPMSASDERTPTSVGQVVKLLQDYRNSYRRERAP